MSGNNLNGTSPPLSSIRQRLRSISRPSSASRSPTPPTVLPSTTTVTNNTLQSSNTHYNQHPHPHPRQTSSPPRPALAPLPGQRRTLSSESNPAANGNTHSPVAGMPWGWPDPDAEQRRAMLGKQIVPNQATLLDDRPPLPTKTPIPTTTPGLSVPGRRRPQPTSPTTTRAPPSGRRSSKASVHSNSSQRRASLPLPQLSPSNTTPTASSSSRGGGVNNSAPFQDSYSTDLYSSLSSFKFGDGPQNVPIHSGYDADRENVGPLALPPFRRPSADQTPRPSLSGPSGISRRRPDSGDDTDDPSTLRTHNRAKMRARELAGARRPSLPTNSYTRAAASGGSSASASTSEAEGENIVGPRDLGPHVELDTDVEFGAAFPRNAGSGRLVPGGMGMGMGDFSDTASVNTFGGIATSSSVQGDDPDPGSPMTFAPRDELDQDPHRFGSHSEDEDYWEPPRTASRIINTGDICYAAPAALPSPGFAQRERERQGSQGTLRIISEIGPLDVLPEEPFGSQPGLGTDTASMNTSLYDQYTYADSASGSGIEIGPAMPAPPSIYEGWDIGYILGSAADGAGSRRPSAYAPSISGGSSGGGSATGGRRSSATSGFAFAGWGRDATAALRKGSIATTRSGGSDDAFMRHLITNDDAYLMRTREWTFVKEKAEGGRELGRTGTVGSQVGTSGIPGVIGDVRTRGSAPVGSQEIWRCEFVGRFKADRAVFRTDPQKPLQHRLNIRHIVDPFSKGNIRGGPSTIVHKHSRALAYSIFREHDLQVIRRSGSGMMSMNLGILLAPKRVQLQYTQTKTTRALKEYGLLDERPRSAAASSATAVSLNQADVSRSSSRKDKEREKKEKEKREKEARKKGKTRDWGAGGTESDVSMSTHSAAASSISSPPPRPGGLSPTSTRQDPDWASSSGRSLSGASVSGTSAISGGTSSARESMSPDPPDMRATFRAPGIDDMDVDPDPYHHELEPDVDVDGPPVQKTTHKEAFGTLESTYFETVRARGDRQEKGGVSVFRRILGFGGGGGQSSLHHHHQGNGRERDRVEPIASNFAPPWISMAPRSQQEEQERVIANLNESFKDVGLMPADERRKARGRSKSSAGLIGMSGGSSSSAGANGKKRRGGAAHEDVFGFVPDDGLFMLVPLWPKETEAAFREPAEPFQPPIDQRQFLVVYYRPHEEAKRKKDKDKRKDKDKDSGGSGLDSSRAKSELGSLEEAAIVAPPASDDPSQLRAFHVCARLVGYDQLRTSGVRVPSYGLSVTGRLAEAAAAIPPPEVRAREYDPVVIALWHGRSKGLELVTEPLEKFGLCVPRDPEMDLDEPVALNVLGRAVAEMAWLGGMALTSFGPV